MTNTTTKVKVIKRIMFHMITEEKSTVRTGRLLRQVRCIRLVENRAMECITKRMCQIAKLRVPMDTIKDLKQRYKEHRLKGQPM